VTAEAAPRSPWCPGTGRSHLYPSGSSVYFTFLVSEAYVWYAETCYLVAWDQAMRGCAPAGGPSPTIAVSGG
jgi:hypothetical protein